MYCLNIHTNVKDTWSMWAAKVTSFETDIFSFVRETNEYEFPRRRWPCNQDSYPIQIKCLMHHIVFVPLTKKVSVECFGCKLWYSLFIWQVNYYSSECLYFLSIGLRWWFVRIVHVILLSFVSVSFPHTWVICGDWIKNFLSSATSDISQCVWCSRWWWKSAC